MSALDRVRSDVLSAVGIGPRLVTAALNDLRTIAEQMARLDQLLEVLASIDAKVDTLNAEVARMRKGVDGIDDRVVTLNATLAEELRQVTLAVHPIRRTTARLKRTGRAAKPDSDAS